MQSRSEAATAALELEHYFTSQTYGHAAAFVLAAELAPPLVEQAQDSNSAVLGDATSGLTDRNDRTRAKEAPIDPRPTVAEAQGSA
jgi:hypothetical protein